MNEFPCIFCRQTTDGWRRRPRFFDRWRHRRWILGSTGILGECPQGILGQTENLWLLFVLSWQVDMSTIPSILGKDNEFMDTHCLVAMLNHHEFQGKTTVFGISWVGVGLGVIPVGRESPLTPTRDTSRCFKKRRTTTNMQRVDAALSDCNWVSQYIQKRKKCWIRNKKIGPWNS